MKKQITKFSIHQTSKVLAFMATSLYAICCLGFGLYTMIHDQAIITGLLIAIIPPILFFVLFYIMYAIMLFLYNICAGVVGGIEFDLKDIIETE